MAAAFVKASTPGTFSSKNPGKKKPATSAPASGFGEIYLQPQRGPGDTPISYGDRLDASEKLVAAHKAPRIRGEFDKDTPPFTLLTQRGEKKAEYRKPVSLSTNRTTHEAPYQPEHGKVEYTGETRFDEELADLEKRKKTLEQMLKQEKNEFAKKKYQFELEDIEKAIPVFKRAAALHYTEGKTNETFYDNPVTPKDDEIRRTLEWYSNLKARREAVRMGNEIKGREAKEVRRLKNVVESLADQLETTRRWYNELQVEAKKVFAGEMPEHMKDTLIKLEMLLKGIQQAVENDTAFDPPENGSLEDMQHLVSDLLRGNIFDENKELEIKKEMTTTHDILQDMLDKEEDITHDSLVARGISEAEADAVIDLLKKQGILS
jgi:hypothetical protein